MKTKLFFIFLIFLLCNNSSILVAQHNNEYDYFENERLERKEKKIKSVKVTDLVKEELIRIDYYDNEGYLIKREVYLPGISDQTPRLYSEYKISPFDTDLNISVEEIVFDGNQTQVLNANYTNKLKLFLELETETIEDEVQYIFNDKVQIVEKNIYYGEDNDFELSRSENYEYDAAGFLISSDFKSGNSLFKTKYSYNNNGLLEKEVGAYDFSNNGRVWGLIYEYEFYP